MDETRYLYQVNPRVPMVLSEINFRSPKSAELTKDDVLKALPKAAIFRRFTDRIERVNTMNLDRLHNEKFMTEKEYEEYLLEKDNKRGQVVVEEKVSVAEAPDKVEDPVVETKVSEPEKVEEEVVNKVEEIPAAVSEPEAEKEEPVEVKEDINIKDGDIFSVVDDEVVGDSSDNKNNYHNKKKRH